MKHYGLIGYPLDHSLSKLLYKTLFLNFKIKADYQVFAIVPGRFVSDFGDILTGVDGINVTMPYKYEVMSYLDIVTPIARNIGNVNVIKKDRGRCIGYNTDYIGFMYSIKQYVDRIKGVKALILGTGGVAKTVAYALKKLGIAYTFVSRTNKSHDTVLYGELTPQVVASHRLIVNCTPLGMFPYVSTYPDIPYQAITSEHVLYDCIYNPIETQFLQKGRMRSATTINGEKMFFIQAVYALKIWL